MDGALEQSACADCEGHLGRSGHGGPRRRQVLAGGLLARPGAVLGVLDADAEVGLVRAVGQAGRVAGIRRAADVVDVQRFAAHQAARADVVLQAQALVADQEHQVGVAVALHREDLLAARGLVVEAQFLGAGGRHVDGVEVVRDRRDSGREVGRRGGGRREDLDFLFLGGSRERSRDGQAGHQCEAEGTDRFHDVSLFPVVEV